MAGEKVRHGFDGRPLRPFGELVTDEPNPDPYPSQMEFATKDGRWATELRDGAWYLVDGAGNVLRDQPITKDQLA